MSEAVRPESVYNIVPITANDNDTVIAFLLKRFFVEEPLNASVDLMNEKHIAEILKNHTIRLLDNGELNNNNRFKWTKVKPVVV